MTHLRVWWVSGQTPEHGKFKQPFCGFSKAEVMADVLLHARVHNMPYVRIDSIDEDEDLTTTSSAWAKKLWELVRKEDDNASR